jgi:hypothetical protein
MTDTRDRKTRRIPAGRLRECFDYSPDTGVLTWKISPSFGVRAGDVAGRPNSTCYGYGSVGLAGGAYRTHRIIWCWMTGEWPVNEIDHINLDRGDNRWINLREASRSQNQANRRASVNNKSGIKGVHFADNRWVSQITVNRKKVYLGCFRTLGAAHAAYVAAVQKYHGEFGRAK